MDNFPLPSLPPRRADSHKGDYGKVLVIAGSETMIGAAALVAFGALRAGCGLVRIAAPKDILPHILTICPLATGFAFSGTKVKELLEFADLHDAVAVGPGLGTAPAVKRLVLELLERHTGPMVLDADALNVLASLETSEWPKRRSLSNVVLTPHMGEYMRLMGAVMKRGADVSLGVEAAGTALAAEEAAEEPRKVKSLVDEDNAPSTADGVVLDLPAEPAAEAAPAPAPAAPAAPAEPDRTPLAQLLSRGTGAVVVLKGHRTVVSDGARSYVNTSGNPAMATAGSGDVLTGVIAALMGQHLPALEAAALGVYAHGRAGDLARDALIGPNAASGGLTALDIAQFVPRALA